MKRWLIYLLLTFIFFLGFYFRLYGIKDNHSFWADEAYISSVARDLSSGKITIAEAVKLPGANYQPLALLISTFSFKLFGASEFSARLPYVIFGTIGILFAYLLAARLSDKSGGLLAAFLYAFSQLNLANSTQAKPYTAIESLILIILYLLFLVEEKKTKNVYLIHLSVIVTACLSTLFHLLGVLAWIPYIVFLLIKYYSKIPAVLLKPKRYFPFLILIGAALFIIKPLYLIKTLFTLQGGKLLPYNHTTLLRELFWRNYAFIILPSIFGIIASYRKNKNLTLGIIVYTAISIGLWNFRHYSHNIRYLLPVFGIFFVYFGVFWAEVGNGLFQKKSWLACLIVASLVFLGGYKIVRKPNIYYSPNADLYGDVQVADYKSVFSTLEKKFIDLSQIVVFNDLIDAQKWYLEKKVDACFMKGVAKPLPHPAAGGTMIYGTLDQFLREKAKHPRGLLIVEDWESILPEEIKQYAKKNMKLEFRIEGLPQAQGDNWPIEVYSWGME